MSPAASMPPASARSPARAEEELADLIGSFTHDPLEFVWHAFPWGEEGSPLGNETGPRDWQAAVLTEIGEALRSNSERGVSEIVREAVASGHGIGKSTLISWILLWGLCTYPDARLRVTANTEQQMRTTTWPEVTKWFEMLICKHWFTFTETAIAAVARPKTWRLDRVTWSKGNVVAFQGLHNKGKRIVLVFDEASAIDDGVWIASDGALTDADTEIVWCAFGNPTQNTGRFRECFGSHRHLWKRRQIDSRTVPGTNLNEIQSWVDLYGDDSDFVRIKVKGEFPRAGSSQFIPGDIVDAAAKREAVSHLHDAMVLGVDVARFGDDMTVIWPRRGRDARTIPPLKFRGLDTMQVASRVAEQARLLGADAIFVDTSGVGGGVFDRLMQMGVPNVFAVDFGAGADGVSFEGDTARYGNKRAEMWGNMRTWLRMGAIPADAEIKADLIGPMYFFNKREEIILEAKDDMKRRGVGSPDLADALALTFAQFVTPARFNAHAGQVLNSMSDQYTPYAVNE